MLKRRAPRRSLPFGVHDDRFIGQAGPAQVPTRCRLQHAPAGDAGLLHSRHPERGTCGGLRSPRAVGKGGCYSVETSPLTAATRVQIAGGPSPALGLQAGLPLAPCFGADQHGKIAFAYRRRGARRGALDRARAEKNLHTGAG